MLTFHSVLNLNLPVLLFSTECLFVIILPIVDSDIILFHNCFYSACNARIASTVLATAIPSICPSVCLSVTRRYCVKTTARSTVQFAPWIAKCVSFCRNQKIFPRDDPFPLTFWLKVTYAFLKAASFDTFCLVAPQP